MLCGDVMTGRGIDQILPHPGSPRLWEPGRSDARGYVHLAEAINGDIPAPVEPSWPWGAALRMVEEDRADLRLLNLETSITRGDEAAGDKSIHYRMSPGNVACLAVFHPDVCALANNHVLDFGRPGLADTLDALAEAGIPTAGAGRNLDEAARPAVVPAPSAGRIAVFSLAAQSSGVPPSWAATPGRAGVWLLPDESDVAADAVAARMRAHTGPDDIIVASVHWGSNWGYQVTAGQVAFAHRLIDRGVDLVHGHSSHHPRPIEVYRGRLILYGCGDLINDYEGIRGYEEYRDDLRLLYLATLQPDGELVRLRMAPLQTRQLRLHHASPADAAHLAAVLSSHGDARVEVAPDGLLELRR